MSRSTPLIVLALMPDARQNPDADISEKRFATWRRELVLSGSSPSSRPSHIPQNGTCARCSGLRSPYNGGLGTLGPKNRMDGFTDGWMYL